MYLSGMQTSVNIRTQPNKHVFKRSWTMCSKYVNHSKINQQCKREDLYDYSMKKRILIFIINKWLIIHMNCKNKEIMGKGGIWICYSSCSKLNVLHSTRSGCRARIVHSKPYLSYFNYQWASSFHFSLQKSKLWQLFESYLFHVLKEKRKKES